MKTFSQFMAEADTKKPHVYKTVTTEYSSKSLKNPNAFGNKSSVSSRKVTDWVAVVNGKHIRGHGTKKSALATWHDMMSRKD